MWQNSCIHVRIETFFKDIFFNLRFYIQEHEIIDNLHANI